MSQNKKFRKFAAASLAATATVVAVAPAVSAAQFEDVAESSVHADNISKLVESGVITGYPGGEFRPTESITRQHVAVMLFRQFDLEVPANKAEILDGFVDVDADHLYADEIAAVVDAGFFIGSGDNFMSQDDTSREQMATVLVRAFGLEDSGEEVNVNLDNVSASHQASVKILAQHGLTTELDDFRPDEPIQRAQFASFVVRTVEAQEAATTIESASVVDVNKIEVEFNQAVNTEEANVRLTRGLANYNVTTEWNEAKDTVVITSVLNKITPATYSVVVEGLAEENLTAEVKVEEEKVAAIEVTTQKVDVAGNATVYFNALNQYGTELSNPSASALTVQLNESIADVSFGGVTPAISSDDNGNLKADFNITDTENKLKAGDTFNVTAVYDGYTAQSTVEFVSPINLNELSFGDVAPLEDKTRIYVGDTDLVVPYTAIDQYGAEYELTAADLGSITFASSNTDIIDPSTLGINTDNELTVDAGTTAGTAVVTAILGDGTTAQFSVTVEAEAKVDSVTIAEPTTLLADGETAKLDIEVRDQFGEIIALEDVSDLSFSNGFAINAESGKLEGTVSENNAFEVTATRVSDSEELAAVTFAVEEAAVATAISAVNFSTVYEVGASKEITTDDVVVQDQYGREIDASTVSLTEKATDNPKFTLATNTVTAAEAGTEVFTVQVDGEASAVRDITLTAVETEDIASYELAEIGTIYASADANYTKDVVLEGQTANGSSVVLVDDKISYLTSSNENVATVSAPTVTGVLTGDNEQGTSTIRAWDTEGNLLGSSVVTVTTVAPELDTIVAADDLASTETVGDIFDAEDQYGVDYTEGGTWFFTMEGQTSQVVTDPTQAVSTFADYNVRFVSEDGETVVSTIVDFNN